MRKRLIASVVLTGAGVVLALGLGAGRRPPSVEVEAGEPATSLLLEDLDRLEARLLLNQQRVHLWGELTERHRKVSALACGNLAEHMAGSTALARRSSARLLTDGRLEASGSVSDAEPR